MNALASRHERMRQDGARLPALPRRFVLDMDLAGTVVTQVTENKSIKFNNFGLSVASEMQSQRRGCRV